MKIQLDQLFGLEGRVAAVTGGGGELCGVMAHTPMGRYGKPQELLGTVIWLLSGASQFVTGIVVPIDGGFSSFSI
jgi:NAD(P)-dependent dehydrogenase (short-subunit alcohol dehydrogenase family)